jgi:hypothetical protein
VQQNLAVLRRAFAIQPQHGEFVGGLGLARGHLVAPVHQALDADTEYRGDAREVGRDLAGAAGLPLRHRAARHADLHSQLILGPALLFARGANPGADVSWIRHCGMLRQFG